MGLPTTLGGIPCPVYASLPLLVGVPHPVHAVHDPPGDTAGSVYTRVGVTDVHLWPGCQRG